MAVAISIDGSKINLTDTVDVDADGKADAIEGGGGDVIGPASNTDGYIPQWNGADSKTLKNGVELSTDGTLGDNSDTAIPTEKAVKTYAAACTIDGGIVS